MISAQTSSRQGRHAVMVEVCNLTAPEKDLLSTTIALLSDPKLAKAKRDLMDGRLAMVMEAGEVTWMEVPS